MDKRINNCGLVEKPQFGKPLCRWEYNMDHKEMGWGMWTGFIWLRMGTSCRFM
jgi:hypothetical protein